MFQSFAYLRVWRSSCQESSPSPGGREYQFHPGKLHPGIVLQPERMQSNKGTKQTKKNRTKKLMKINGKRY